MFTSQSLPFVIVCSFFTVTCTVATLLRCYVRRCLLKTFGLDDYLMVAAWVAFLCLTGVAQAGLFFGSGQRNVDLSPWMEKRGMIIWFASQPLYGLTAFLARQSITHYYFRLTNVRWHHWLIYLGFFGNVTSAISFIFITTFQCAPISFYWNKIDEGASGSCIPLPIIVKLGYMYGAAAASLDLGFALTPIDIMRRIIGLGRGQKLVITLLLSTGGIACGAVIIRMIVLPRILEEDFLYATVPVQLWSEVEVGLAITSGSIATLRPLFVKKASPQHSNSSGRTAQLPRPTALTGPTFKELVDMTTQAIHRFFHARPRDCESIHSDFGSSDVFGKEIASPVSIELPSPISKLPVGSPVYTNFSRTDLKVQSPIHAGQEWHGIWDGSREYRDALGHVHTPPRTPVRTESGSVPVPPDHMRLPVRTPSSTSRGSSLLLEEPRLSRLPSVLAKEVWTGDKNGEYWL